MWPRPRLSRDDTGLDVRRVRGHFDFTRTGRVVTNNAATTQPPRELVDERTKLVACTGASNFLGTKPPLDVVRAISRGSGYRQPSGESGSLLLVDAAQLVPSTAVDVQALDVDYLAFSFHKMLAPF